MYKVLPESGVGQHTDNGSSFHEIRPRPNHVKNIYGHRTDILKSALVVRNRRPPVYPPVFVEILAPKRRFDKAIVIFLRNINRAITILKAAGTYTCAFLKAEALSDCLNWSRFESPRFER